MNLSGWKCSRCGSSPKDGDDLMERWGARGFLNHAVPNVYEGDVMFRLSDLDSLVCSGCLSPADLAEYKTLPVISGEYLARASA